MNLISYLQLIFSILKYQKSMSSTNFTHICGYPMKFYDMRSENENFYYFFFNFDYRKDVVSEFRNHITHFSWVFINIDECEKIFLSANLDDIKKGLKADFMENFPKLLLRIGKKIDTNDYPSYYFGIKDSVYYVLPRKISKLEKDNTFYFIPSTSPKEIALTQFTYKFSSYNNTLTVKAIHFPGEKKITCYNDDFFKGKMAQDIYGSFLNILNTLNKQRNSETFQILLKKSIFEEFNDEFSNPLGLFNFDLIENIISGKTKSEKFFILNLDKKPPMRKNSDLWKDIIRIIAMVIFFTIFSAYLLWRLMKKKRRRYKKVRDKQN